MASERLVIGRGPDALRAAAVLAASGKRVVLLQEGPGASGLRHPELPVGNGLLHVQAEDRALTERVLGALVEAPDVDRAVLSRGRVRRLPLSPLEVHELLPPEARLGAARAWLRRRARNVSIGFVGGGQEERSYRDWVVRRMGGPAWHHLYRDYARRRWGADAETLSPSLARLHHATPDAGPHQVVGGGPAEALARAAAVVAEAGGEIRAGVAIDRLEVQGGRVAAVVLAGGERLDVAAPLWVAVSPLRVAGWLGAATPGAVEVDVRLLACAPAVRVALRGSTDGLPTETHVLDEGAPFWRVVSPYGVEQTAIFHITGEVSEPDDVLAARVAAAAGDLGLGSFSVDGHKVERLDKWQPVWGAGVHSRMRRVLQAWRSLGLVGVGRAGGFRALDPGEEVRLAARYADADDPDQVEVHRELLLPVPWQDDLAARITRFVER